MLIIPDLLHSPGYSIWFEEMSHFLKKRILGICLVVCNQAQLLVYFRFIFFFLYCRSCQW